MYRVRGRHKLPITFQVKEVSTNLFMIMRDTVRMTEVKQDKDLALRIDLMYRIAKGYQNSPALRITWLKSMADEHKQVKFREERKEFNLKSKKDSKCPLIDFMKSELFS